MIKLVYCLRKRKDVPAAEFYQYWLESHGPRVRSYAKTINALKYVQSHTIAPDINQQLIASRGLAEPYDGITEVWWKSEESFKAGFGSAAAQQAREDLLQDESKFIDFANSRVFITREHLIFEYPNGH